MPVDLGFKHRAADPPGPNSPAWNWEHKDPRLCVGYRRYTEAITSYDPEGIGHEPQECDDKSAHLEGSTERAAPRPRRRHRAGPRRSHRPHGPTGRVATAFS